MGTAELAGYHGPVEELRFSCDAMLGSLARWLRFAGLDTLYAPHTADQVLAEEARQQGRWLLTRDRLLASSAGPRVVLLRESSVAGQVAELLRRLPLELDRSRVFSRCSACNGLLEDVAREEVLHQVPPYVAVNAGRFRRCPECGKVYWPGTHVTRIQRRLAQLFSSSGW